MCTQNLLSAVNLTLNRVNNLEQMNSAHKPASVNEGEILGERGPSLMTTNSSKYMTGELNTALAANPT